nr:MAG TPA: hypothetical protein [Bacteriophage sp.]
MIDLLFCQNVYHEFNHDYCFDILINSFLNSLS